MGLAFGLEPRIDLHGMGGTTSWATPRDLGRRGGSRSASRDRARASPRGPSCAGGSGPAPFPAIPLGGFVYDELLYVNFGWGMLNLLPMLPLDGGNVTVQLLNALTGGKGERPARIVSIVVAGLALLLASDPVLVVALLAFSFALSNWRGLKDLPRASTTRRCTTPQGSLRRPRRQDGARVLELARPWRSDRERPRPGRGPPAPRVRLLARWARRRRRRGHRCAAQGLLAAPVPPRAPRPRGSTRRRDVAGVSSRLM